MTSQYTQTTNILTSKLIQNTFSVQTSNHADSDTFSSLLNNASKPYVDRTENKITSKHDYAQKTKEAHEENHKDLKSKYKEDKNPHQDSKQISNENNSSSSERSEKKSKSDTQQDTDIKASEKNPNEVSQEAFSQERFSSDDNVPENTLEKQAQELSDNESNSSVTKQMSEQAAYVLQDCGTEQQKNAQDITSAPDIKVTAEAKNKANTIVNEQILANIEYSDEDNIQMLSDSSENIKIDAETLKKIVEQAKKSSQTETQGASQIIAKQNETLDDVINNLKKTTNQQVDVDVQTKMSEQTVNTSLKTAKDSLAADTSRLTANLEQTAQTVGADSLEKVDIKPVTPANTDNENTPVIKVTDEVATQVKEPLKESYAARVENKDTVSAVKDKAVAQMTKLQETETVVTESTMNFENGAEQNSNNGTNFAQTNAGETAVKLSVDEGAIRNTQVSADSFVNKLDAQLNAKGASSVARTNTVNQADILSQVNAKFDELQKSGNNKVSIILQPENLGKVSVEIMNSKDGIVAKMTTDSQQVKELFDKNIEALKSNLSSQGVNVNNIKVECTQESVNQGMSFEQEQFNQSFNNQQNGQNQAHQSKQNSKELYGSDYETSFAAEEDNGVEIKNTDTMIKHNGKVDYKV